MRLAFVLLAVSTTAWASPQLRLMAKADREAAEAELVASLGTSAHAKVLLDDAGLINDFEMTLPETVKDGERVESALELVRAHAKAYGVIDPKALHAKLDDSSVWIGEGARWSGSIQVMFGDRKLTTFGHLWPVTTPAKQPAFDQDRLLHRFYGLEGTAPSHCKCRDQDHFKISKDDFEVHGGVALVCKNGAFAPRLAIVVQGKFRGNVKGLDELPWLLDATSHQRITDDFVMPAFGSGENYPASAEIAMRATNKCFYKDKD